MSLTFFGIADVPRLGAQSQSQEAMARFKAGMEHFDAGRFEPAIAEFDRAIGGQIR